MYRTFITETLKEAAEIAQTNFGNVTSSTKPEDNNQVLTEADLAIGQLIIAKIQQAFPEHNIIDEEAGIIDKGSRYTWVIDPIDGTSNFANGTPLYGSMFGLLEDGSPLAGGVVLPFFRDVYYAEKGQGAFRNGAPIHVMQEERLLSTLVAYGIDGHQEDPDRTFAEAQLLAKIVLGVRNLRSSNSVFDLMMVAEGRYGGCLNQTTKIWDNVAPQIIIEEAGGTFTDFFGEPMDYSNPLTRVDENFTWCTAAPKLHQQLQVLINQ